MGNQELRSARAVDSVHGPVAQVLRNRPAAALTSNASGGFRVASSA